MDENKMNLCRYLELNNAIFQPSIMELASVIMTCGAIRAGYITYALFQISLYKPLVKGWQTISKEQDESRQYPKLKINLSEIKV